MNDKERIHILATELAFILKGLASGSIKSKPIIDTSDDSATEWPMMGLGEHIDIALARAGINMLELGKKYPDSNKLIRAN